MNPLENSTITFRFKPKDADGNALSLGTTTPGASLNGVGSVALCTFQVWTAAGVEAIALTNMVYGATGAAYPCTYNYGAGLADGDYKVEYWYQLAAVRVPQRMTFRVDAGVVQGTPPALE